MGYIAETVGRTIFAGENSKDSRQVLRSFAINVGDLGMRIGRADHHCVGLVWQLEIITKLSAAGEQAFVLLSPDWLPDGFVHNSYRTYLRASRTGVLGLMPLCRIFAERLPFSM